MIIKREVVKKRRKLFDMLKSRQVIRVESWWLLGIIPLYIRTEVIGGDVF